jgi:hypothetical protein
MQDLLKIINRGVDDYSVKIDNFKMLYKQLPEDNWFKKGEHLISDHKQSDEGIVDLLLHCQDRSYTINELYEWVNNCGLNIVTFSPDTRYKYEFNIAGIDCQKDIVEKYAANELFFGDMIMHNFLLSKRCDCKANIEDLNNIMIFVMMPYKVMRKILEYYEVNKDPVVVVNTNLTYNLHESGDPFWIIAEKPLKFEFEINDVIHAVLNNIDNKKTTMEIFNTVRDELGINISDDELLDIFTPAYKILELYDFILLKNK